ncbi:MAG: hypothetical protein M1826_001756 [Phylliscum demangeonii]|nr:MAG: hypothetical protein M1826_001756 [Phylliscum demangeonii]
MSTGGRARLDHYQPTVTSTATNPTCPGLDLRARWSWAWPSSVEARRAAVVPLPDQRPVGPCWRPTEKLELPSLSQVHTRGPVDVPWYNPHIAPRPLAAVSRLPSLAHAPRPLPLPFGPAALGPRSLGEDGALPAVFDAVAVPSAVKLHHAADRSGLPTPPGSDAPSSSPDHAAFTVPPPPPPAGLSDPYAHDAYAPSGMEHAPPYLDLHPPHLAAGPPPHAPPMATASAVGHYSSFGPPPLLQPGPGAYAPTPGAFGLYAYANGVPSPQTTGHASSHGPGATSHLAAQLLPLPAMTSSAPTPSAPGAAGAGPATNPPLFDTTGQLAPPGMKPRVTATLWEDEGSLCFQVEANSICVARREGESIARARTRAPPSDRALTPADNHMINGTKLLNVAAMTRGRRDGILKSEKQRHVVKIGPMHLKGVWIPFERALEFANREKITHLLYPLFVHNIGALLYHPSNQPRPTGILSAADRRRPDGGRPPPTPQPPSALPHHHALPNGGMSGHLSGPPPPLAVGGHGARPGLDRAHTFPTPPTSAHSILGVGGADGAYGWSGPSLGGPSGHPLSVDVGLSNARSMPSTPATTPPGASLQSMTAYGHGSAYDGPRPTYAAPSPSPHPYASQGTARFGPPLPPSQYIKHEMGPPAARASGPGPEPDRTLESRSSTGLIGHGPAPDSFHPAPGEDEADHEHDAEYGHDGHAAAAAAAAAAYGSSRASYGYGGGSAVGGYPTDHAHLSPEINGSPGHHATSGRATPRTSQTSQHAWGTDYQTPPRPQAASSNLYSVMSPDQYGKSAHTSATDDGYHAQLGLAGAMPTAYAAPSQSQASSAAAPSLTLSNGTASSSKRMREMDDESGRGTSRPASRGPHGEAADLDGLKRRKTLRDDGSMSNGGGVGGSGSGSGNGNGSGSSLVANGVVDAGDASRGLNRTRSTGMPRRR